MHTVNVNAADIPSFVQNFAGKSLKYNPVVKPQTLFQLQKPDPEASSCVGLTFMMRHARKSACSHVFLAVCGVRSCRLLLKQAFIPTFDTQKARANMAETHAEGRTALHNLSFLDKKAINLLCCNRWVRLIDTDKNLGTALVESQWIEDQLQISFKQTTHHTSETEASQKNIAGGQTLGIITERVIETSVIEENHRGFVTCKQQKHNCTFLSHPRKDPQVANLQQAHWQLPHFLSRNSLYFLSSYLQPVVKSCRHVIGSHAPIIGWAETAQFEEHDIMFTFDI